VVDKIRIASRINTLPKTTNPFCFHPMTKGGHVYILANAHHTVLHTGMTSDLIRRMHQHRNKFYPKSFSAAYNVNLLLYYQFYPTIMEAIREEKRIKGGNRAQKMRLINSMNPQWEDLWEKEVSKW
jgi:putative endonuclease